MADEKEKKVATNKTAEKKTTKTETKTETKTVSAKKETAKKEAVKKETTKKEAIKKETVKKEENKATKTVNKKVEKSATQDELVARAEARYVRISSRKVAIVANLIRGKNVDEAMAILEFTPKAGKEVLIKLLKSAIANAENNNGMDHSKLYVAEIYSNQGPTLKRIRPAAKGSAVRIRKRTSNTTIVLKERN